MYQELSKKAKIFYMVFLGVIIASMSAISPIIPVSASVGANPHADVIIKKVFDGTGHNTPDATYVNTANGFIPGDDTPTDGIVSSNDIVGYDVTLLIGAGLARTITVDMEGSEFLSWTDKTSFCSNLPGIKSTIVGDSCRFEIGQGATAQITRKVFMTAGDSQGKAIDNQTLNISYGLSNDLKYATVNSDPVTVVSAPKADLIARGGTTYTWSNSANSGKGSFTIEARALKPVNYSPTKGVSNNGEWQATVDVSEFPTGTTWKLGNEDVPVINNKLEISGNGNKTLSFTMPNGEWPEQDEGETLWYSIGLTVPTTAFESEHYLNNGDGWQPGTGVSRETSTFDTEIGSIRGYLYPNNDHSAIRVARLPEVEGEIFEKYLEVPYTPSETLFENGNIYWENASSTQSSYAINPITRTVPVQYDAILKIHTNNASENFTKLVIADYWNPQQAKVIGNITVTDESDNIIDPSLYTLQWNAGATNDSTITDPNNTTGWITTNTPLPNANAIRIIFNDNAIQYNTGTYTARIPMQILENYPQTSDPVVRDTMHGKIDSITGQAPGALLLTWPKDNPSLQITQNVNNDMIAAGDTLEYTVTPRVKDPVSLEEGFQANIQVELDKCMVAPQNTSSNIWDMTITPGIPGPTGRICGDEESTPAIITFTPKGKTHINHSSWNFYTQTATLPNITYSARTRLSAIESVSTSAIFNVSGLGEIIPVSDSSQTSIFEQSISSASILSDPKKAEINETLKWEITLLQQSSSNNELATVIAFPRNGDSTYWDESLDPENNYPDAKESNFNGTYEVKNISTNDDDTSIGVDLWFTIDEEPSLDPSVNQWYKVSDAGTNGVPNINGATALKVIGAPGGESLTSLINVELQPTDNQRDDTYVMWVGETIADGNGEAAAPQPWPASVNVVMSDITGTIWWDEDNSATMEPTETRIPNVEVGLFPIINGETSNEPIAITTTNNNGEYEFLGYHSGNYRTIIVARGENLPENITSYYGENINIETTFSFNNQRYVRSSLSSTIFNLGIDSQQDDVDFGFFSPNPLVDTDKDPGVINCTDGICEILWKITITNLGNTPINSGTFTDTSSKELYNVEAFFGEFTETKIVKTVARRSYGGFALTENGEVYSWGLGSYGANGNGSTNDNLTAQLVQGLDGEIVTDVIERGTDGGFALTESGEVYSWGSGSYGANGNGSTNNNSTAQLVQGLDGKIVTDVIERSNGGFALTESGEVYSWGSGSYGANGNGSDENNLIAQLVQGLDGEIVTDVIERDNYGGFALTESGEVYSWGLGRNGANGNGSDENNLIAQLVQGLDGEIVTDVIERSNGGFALTESGEVYSWGRGSYGANGNGSTSNNSTAQLVQGLDGEIVTDVIARGTDGGFALTESGEVYSWGRGYRRANGDGSTSNNLTAQLVQGLDGKIVTDVITHSYGGFALTENGEVYSWGDGSNGTNGNGSTSNNSTAKLVQGLDGKIVTDVITRSSGGWALTESGEVYSWGSGAFGANGNGSDENNLIAQLVQGLDGKIVTDVIERSSYGGFALTESGEVYSWGLGRNGANGNGSDENNPTAQLVQGIEYIQLLFDGAVPAVAVNDLGNFVERQYRISHIPAGESIDVIVRGNINAGVDESIVLNQAWFTSGSTPIGGLLPDGQSRPDLPENPLPEFNPVGIVGNATCDTDADGQNLLSPDSCDQVPVMVPALSDPDTFPGSISGLMWFDVNMDGVKDDGEPEISGMRVNLFQNGVLRGSTFTGADGSYLFDNVPPGSNYSVTFDLASVEPSADELDLVGLESGSFGPTVDLDRAPDQSWMSADNFTTGEVTVVPGGVEEWLNGGVVLVDAGLSVVKTSAVGDPASVDLNADGLADDVEVSMSFTNTGSEALTGFSWVDETLEGPELVDLVCNADPVSLVLDPGETVDCTAVLRGLSVDSLTHADRFTVSAIGVITGTPVVGSDDWSVVANGDASWSLSKVSDPVSGSIIGTGSEITYVVTAVNTGDLTLRELEVFDDMSGVLNNAVIVGDLPDGVIRSGDTLVWVIDELDPGTSVSIEYVVKVNDDAWGETLVNRVSGVGDVPPMSCTSDNPCVTEHDTPPWPGALPLPVLGNVTLLVLIGFGAVFLVGGLIVLSRKEGKIVSE